MLEDWPALLRAHTPQPFDLTEAIVDYFGGESRGADMTAALRRMRPYAPFAATACNDGPVVHFFNNTDRIYSGFAGQGKTFPIQLWRGCVPGNEGGASWTTQPEVAKIYARARGGRVITARVSLALDLLGVIESADRNGGIIYEVLLRQRPAWREGFSW